MRLVYFTLGTSLLDPQVRSQLARIPEVLSEIRKVKLQSKLHGEDAVMAFLGLNDLKNTSVHGSLEDWVRVVQKGLFHRLRKTGFKYSGLIKRSRLQSQLSLESVLVPLLQSKAQIDIYVIGPGFDDLKVKIDQIQKSFRLQCDVRYIDVINQDKKLGWFWSEILEPHPRGPFFAETDLLRH